MLKSIFRLEELWKLVLFKFQQCSGLGRFQWCCNRLIYCPGN